jgi:hypothetical protein
MDCRNRSCRSVLVLPRRAFLVFDLLLLCEGTRSRYFSSRSRVGLEFRVAAGSISKSPDSPSLQAPVKY